MVKFTQEIKFLIENTVLAFSTSSLTGAPNNIAIAYVKVVSDNQILISDNYFNKTRVNLSQNNQVAIALWNKENSPDGAGFQLKGTADVLTTGKYKELVDSFDFNQGQAHKAAILVTITEIWDLADPKLICKQ